MLMAKQGYQEIIRLIHPKIIRPLKIKGRVYDETVLSGVRGFFALYVAVFSLAMLLLMLGGLDQVTAFSAVATSMNNFGPGLGEVAANFQHITDWQKIILAGCMLLGRLELFTILILLTPGFWKR
jgi:trk system potassium uptake protein TrkH